MHQVEYAKTDRSSCKSCGRGISQGSLRASTTEYNPRIDRDVTNWHHWGCFCSYFRTPRLDETKGLEMLRATDLERVMTSLGSVVSAARKAEAQEVYDMFKWFQDNFKKAGLITFLEYNGYDKAAQGKSPSELAWMCADGRVRGSMPACPKCKSTLYLQNFNFVCRGWWSEFTPCDYTSTSESRGTWYDHPTQVDASTAAAAKKSEAAAKKAEAAEAKKAAAEAKKKAAEAKKKADAKKKAAPAKKAAAPKKAAPAKKAAAVKKAAVTKKAPAKKAAAKTVKKAAAAAGAATTRPRRSTRTASK